MAAPLRARVYLISLIQLSRPLLREIEGSVVAPTNGLPPYQRKEGADEGKTAVA